jgi:hypothetical protein
VLETPHVVVGAAIALKTGNPYLAIPMAFASHFVLDKIPHWNPHLNSEKRMYGKLTSKTTKIVLIDVLLSLAVGFFLASQVLPDTTLAATVIACCFAAVLPDVIEGPHFFLGMKSNFVDKWMAFQKSIQSDAGVIPGLATQVITMAAAFWWIYY